MKLVNILISIFFIFSISVIAIIYIPIAYYNFFIIPNLTENLSILEIENLKSEFRKIILAILGGSLAVGGFILTYYRTKTLDDTRLLTQRGQWNDRYAKGIELIDKEASDIRIGGIYSLISIAEESQYHKSIIIKILCLYIREKMNIKKRIVPDPNDKDAMEIFSIERERFPIDNEAILEFISNLDVKERKEGNNSLILLKFIDFTFYHFNTIDLSYSELSEIDFTYSKISTMNLSYSKIHNISIRYTQSTSLDFTESLIIRSRFEVTNLIFCSFIKSKIVIFSFNGSVLNYCDFTKAELKKVSFDESVLIGCNFLESKIDDKNIF